MIAAERLASALTIVGRGEARRHQPELFETRLRTVVRYADPTAWICANAVAHAVAPFREALETERDRIGVIGVCDEGPQEAMQALRDAAAEGFSSPLRFPAANPGSLVGVTCILFGFRGPSTNFIMPPAAGVPTALVVAGRWLRNRVCSAVVVTACAASGSPGWCARSLLLSARGEPFAPAAPFAEADMTWLRFVDPEPSGVS